MAVMWIQRTVRIIFSIILWEKAGLLLAILFFIACIPLNFLVLLFVNEISIISLKKHLGVATRDEAADFLLTYQRVPHSPSTLSVTFYQLILGPALAIAAPIILGGIVIHWNFRF